MRKGLESEKILILMEYADAGDLRMMVKRQRELKQYLQEADILNLFVQIALGLRYIHKKKILHRDLKTENIFVTSTKLVKIGDFGISKILAHTLDLATTAIGTPFYLSPEICRGQPYSHKSDMWSLGIIISTIGCSITHPGDPSNPIHPIPLVAPRCYIRLRQCSCIQFSRKWKKNVSS